MPDSTSGLAITSPVSSRPSPHTSAPFSADMSLAVINGVTGKSRSSPPFSPSCQVKRGELPVWYGLRIARMRWNCSSSGCSGSP
ncbi:hypothetical protein G6F63_016129 [Rhizopus arrhizus]|nr:hypothetical protein G6F63_016129 [Rhizopus arrhizus]